MIGVSVFLGGACAKSFRFSRSSCADRILATMSGLVPDFLGGGGGTGFRAAIGCEIGGGDGFFEPAADAAGPLPSTRNARLLTVSLCSAIAGCDFFPECSVLPLLSFVLAGGASFATTGFGKGTFASLGCGLVEGGALERPLAGLVGFTLETALEDVLFFPEFFTLVFFAFTLGDGFGNGFFLAETLPLAPFPADAGRAIWLVFFFFAGGTCVSPRPSIEWAHTLGVVRRSLDQYAYRCRTFLDSPPSIRSDARCFVENNHHSPPQSQSVTQRRTSITLNALSRIFATLVLLIAFGVGGAFLDRWLGTSFCVVIGFALGMILAVVGMIYVIKVAEVESRGDSTGIDAAGIDGNPEANPEDNRLGPTE